MDDNIKELIELTTIVKVEDNVSHKLIYGDELYISRFEREHMTGFEKEQKEQVDLDSLVQNWKNKWQSFGNLWDKERQNYRFLYDSFKFFYFSFEQLRSNKVACINESFRNRLKMLHFNELTGVCLYGVYHHGKKCIDLLKELKLIDENHNDWEFLEKFRGTRNKLIEHNYNPEISKGKRRKKLNLQIDLSIWSLGNTDSLLEINIHKPNIERAFNAYVDYYEDYYKLEKIITDIIKGF